MRSLRTHPFTPAPTRIRPSTSASPRIHSPHAVPAPSSVLPSAHVNRDVTISTPVVASHCMYRRRVSCIGECSLDAAVGVLWQIYSGIFVANVSPVCNPHPHDVPGGSRLFFLATAELLSDTFLVTLHLHVCPGFSPTLSLDAIFIFQGTMLPSAFVVLP